MFDLPAYNDFRTGFTFDDVRQILNIEQKEKYKLGEYMFITRATVLGRWREIKLRMYREEEKLFELFGKSMKSF